MQRISDAEYQSSYPSTKSAGLHAVIPTKFIFNFVGHSNRLRRSKACCSRAWQPATWERMTPTIKWRAVCQYDSVILKRGPGFDSQQCFLVHLFGIVRQQRHRTLQYVTVTLFYSIGYAEGCLASALYHTSFGLTKHCKLIVWKTEENTPSQRGASNIQTNLRLTK